MVVIPRSTIAMAAIWFVAVAGVSATAWFAIDRAGRDLTSVSTLAPAPLITPAQEAVPTKTRAKPKPTATTKPTTAADPSPTHGHPSIPVPVALPTPVAPPAETGTPRPAPPAQPSPPAQPTAQDKTISVNGGLISVRCTGEVIALRVAQPDNQWRVMVDTSLPGQISVTFTSGGEENQQRTLVIAVCTNGTPVFSSPRH